MRGRNGPPVLAGVTSTAGNGGGVGETGNGRELEINRGLETDSINFTAPPFYNIPVNEPEPESGAEPDSEDTFESEYKPFFFNLFFSANGRPTPARFATCTCSTAGRAEPSPDPKWQNSRKQRWEHPPPHSATALSLSTWGGKTPSCLPVVWCWGRRLVTGCQEFIRCGES